MKVRIPLIARDSKTSHRNIAIVQLGQQRIVIRIIVSIIVVAISG
jgi:hypothetical protein